MIPTNEKLLEMASAVATYSRDTSRKTGCVIVTEEEAVTGCNNIPNGVCVYPARLERPAKYVFTEHAERTAIYRAAKFGIKLFGAVAAINWFPCAECARALVSAGISRLVCLEPDWQEERYGFKDALAILSEAGVTMTYMGRAQ